MKWDLIVSLKFLTPSSALRDSRLRSPFCISASPTSLFLQYWSSFSCSKHCKIQPIINHLLILEPRSWPSKSGAILAVIPLAATHWSVDSARYAPTTDSAFVLVFSVENVGKSSTFSSLSLIISIIETLNNTHNGTLYAARSSSSTTTSAPLPLCGC